MNHEPIPYNYAALCEGMLYLALLVIAVMLIVGKWDALRRGLAAAGQWLREKRGDVLSVAVLLVSAIRAMWIPMGLVALFSLAIGLAIK